MAELDIDGHKVTVPDGSMVMHAADAAGVYIPHFCYHKKLSIAANCRGIRTWLKSNSTARRCRWPPAAW